MAIASMRRCPIVGDTGTGKDILVRACHLRSLRGKQPFPR
ncbi:sigma 54-interacting transcriptional regulator [Serratia ureilytica]